MDRRHTFKIKETYETDGSFLCWFTLTVNLSVNKISQVLRIWHCDSHLSSKSTQSYAYHYLFKAQSCVVIVPFYSLMNIKGIGMRRSERLKRHETLNSPSGEVLVSLNASPTPSPIIVGHIIV